VGFGDQLEGSDVNADGFGDLLIGAVGADGVGKVYLYLGGADGIASSPAMVLLGPDGSDHFGVIASAGDVNADGFPDIIVGAGTGYIPDAHDGRQYLFLGNAQGLGSVPAAVLEGPEANGVQRGYSLKGAGDVNADGFADVVIGEFQGEGRLYVYFGNEDGIPPNPAVAITGPDGPSSSFGLRSAGVGDVDRDGFGDVAVGAYQVDNYSGRAHLYRGRASGLLPTPDVTLSDPNGQHTRFGSCIAGAN
jgi:hypothetical protein